MTEEEMDTRRKEVRDEMEKLMQEYLNLTDSNEGTNGILTACVISFEGTRFEEDGQQVYRADHLALGPTSYSATIGILNETLWQIHHRGFGHCHGGD